MDFSAIPIWRGGTLNFVSYMGVRVSERRLPILAVYSVNSLNHTAVLQLHPEALTLATHATPEDAVSIHSDVLSRSSLAIHYATFAGSEDEATYPIALLEEACKKADIDVSMNEDDGFGVCDVGETLVIPVRPDVVYQDSKEQQDDTNTSQRAQYVEFSEDVVVQHITIIIHGTQQHSYSWRQYTELAGQ